MTDLPDTSWALHARAGSTQNHAARRWRFIFWPLKSSLSLFTRCFGGCCFGGSYDIDLDLLKTAQIYG